MKYPFEKQIDLKDCGVCCLLMLVRYYGGGVSKEYLRKLTNTTKEGVTAYSLIEGAKILGFSGYGVKGNINSMKKTDLPCIAHVILNKSYQHFIVIYKIDYKNNSLVIADPSKNKISKISYQEFQKISTNQFILLKPQKKIMYIEKNTILKDLIIQFLISSKRQIIVIILFSFLITSFNILLSFQLKILLEYSIAYNSMNNLIFICILFGWIILIKELSNYYRTKEINFMNHQLDKSLFLNVYHHILSLPYLYYKNRTTGEIISRMEDLSSIRNVISKLLITIFLDLILAIFTLITLLILNVKLTCILIISIFLLGLIILIFRPLLEKKMKKSKEEGAKLNSFIVESLEGIETIKNQNIQTFMENNFLFRYCKFNKNSLFYNQLFIIEQFFKDIINQYGTLLIMMVGSYLVIKNELEIATLITFITLMSYLLEPIKNIIDLDLSVKDARTSFERIHELYEIEEEKLDLNKKQTTNKLLGYIKAEHLMYSYNGKDLFLKDINLEINPKDKVLIYGSSGSGKSTLARVLSKQLEINQKQLFYDNKDIHDFSINQIREELCYISQQESIFTDSIYQNIVLNKELDYNDFLNIAKCCMIDEFVCEDSLSYDKLLEENGFNLSGGQRQRIILARAMLKDAKIYILDESLNEVDIYKERQILINLFENYPDKTFIIISHRFDNQDLFTKKYRIDEGVSYEE